MNGDPMNGNSDIRSEGEVVERCGRLTVTLCNDNSKPKSDKRQHQRRLGVQQTAPEHTEVIKVYLKKPPEKEKCKQPRAKMLTDEVSQIQEVRYCLKSLREQMAARHNNNNNNKMPTNGYKHYLPSSPSVIMNGNTDPPLTQEEDDEENECVRLREVTRRLYSQLQETQRRHQEDRERLQAKAEEWRHRVEEQTSRAREAEEEAGAGGQQVQELQRLLGKMEEENRSLQDKMAAKEAELQELRAQKKEEGQEEEEDGEKAAEKKRSEELEKELAVLKEKIHHLDDMLKSQQRKVRHMIEQLQNSRTVLQERDRHIGDLQEKIAFLEAENCEMRDQMEFLMGDKKPQTNTPKSPQIVYSKPLTPTGLANKSLPFIKVIEIKS